MIFEFVLLSLAVWRLSSLLHRENGPFDMFDFIRYHLGVRYDETNRPYGKTMLGRGVLCFWCASVWISFPVAFLSGYSVNFRNFMLVWLSLSAAAIFIDEMMLSRK